LQGFLESCTQQTIFDEIDFYVYDAASTGKEQQIMKQYTKKYSNIHHLRDEKKIGSSEAFNKMMLSSPNDLVAMISLDDRPAPYYAELLRKYLAFSGKDLVYGDCFQTRRPNETFFNNTCNSIKYSHSLQDFQPEHMIKSQPGPMPMFKKEIILKNGGFDVEYKHVNDWELWLRCVRAGAEFLKVHRAVGLYYLNPDGVTTAKKHEANKRKEEKRVFYEYKDVFGEKNFEFYKAYFDQF